MVVEYIKNNRYAGVIVHVAEAKHFRATTAGSEKWFKTLHGAIKYMIKMGYKPKVTINSLLTF